MDNRLSLDEVGKVIKDIMSGDEDYQAEIMKPDFMERCNSLCFDSERFFNCMGYGSALIELCVYSYCIATTPARKKAEWGLVLLAWWQMAMCTRARGLLERAGAKRCSCVCGNVAETPLQEIWDNSERFKWLRSLRMKDLGGGECCKCDKAAFCAPCMVRNAK